MSAGDEFTRLNRAAEATLALWRWRSGGRGLLDCRRAFVEVGGRLGRAIASGPGQAQESDAQARGSIDETTAG